jgi:Tol biopolymer transport system component
MNWLPDGRLIYVGGEQGIHGMSCNLFEARIDERSERLLAKPHQLTNWAGFCVTTFSATADGKKLAFNRSSESLTVYIGEFDPAKLRLSTPRRLTFTDDLSSPAGWSPDSTAVFVRSNREGSWGIYKQPVSGASSEPLATGLKDVSWTTPVSPDGKWLLYGSPDDFNSTTHWMRLPVRGGPSEQIANSTNKDAVLCARTSAAACVSAEWSASRREIIFKTFDPIEGGGQELAQFNDEHANEFAFDLSPDGSMIVLFGTSIAGFDCSCSAIIRQPRRFG